MSSAVLPAARSASTAWAVTASSLKARMTWPTGLRMPVVSRMSSLVNRLAVMSTTPGWASARLRRGAGKLRSLSLAPLQPRMQLADEPAPERDDADHEDDADDDRDPLADAVGEQVLQADDRERAQHWPGERSHAAEERHQDDLAGERPVRVRQRREAEHQRLERAAQARQRRRQDEGEQLVAVDVVAERDGARLVLADRLEHLAVGRVDDPADEQEDGDEDGEDDEVHDDVVGHRQDAEQLVVRRAGERQDAEQLSARHALQAVFAAGDRAPLQEDEVGHLGERQGRHREVDALAADRDEADDQAEQRREGDAGDDAELGRPALGTDQPAGGVGGSREESGMAKRQEA